MGIFRHHAPEGKTTARRPKEIYEAVALSTGTGRRVDYSRATSSDYQMAIKAWGRANLLDYKDLQLTTHSDGAQPGESNEGTSQGTPDGPAVVLLRSRPSCRPTGGVTDEGSSPMGAGA